MKEYRNKSFDFIFTGVDDLLGNSFMYQKPNKRGSEIKQDKLIIGLNVCLGLILNQIKAVDECLKYRLAELQYSKGRSVSILLQGQE